eukprot:7020251-Pyramimonas_sp.AAC.1
MPGGPAFLGAGCTKPRRGVAIFVRKPIQGRAADVDILGTYFNMRVLRRISPAQDAGANARRMHAMCCAVASTLQACGG